LKPKLIKENILPMNAMKIISGEKYFQGWGIKQGKTIAEISAIDYGNGDSFILDLGKHIVGHLSFSVQVVATIQDSPLRLKFTFGETPFEMVENEANYHGTLSSTWLQNDIVNVDVIPNTIKLSR
jgi:hypothetical protein